MDAVAEPTENDVHFAKGQEYIFFRKPGNMKLRKEVLCHLAWYKVSSPEEKRAIAVTLVESVKNEGHRFLQKDDNGLWREMIEGKLSRVIQMFRESYKTPILNMDAVAEQTENDVFFAKCCAPTHNIPAT